MSERTLRRLVSALRVSGAEDVAIENGKHHKLYFSINGGKAGPVIISKTPSDRLFRVKVAADIRREFKRLGVEPPTGLALGAVFASFSGSIAGGQLVGLIAKMVSGSLIRHESIWELLDKWDKDPRGSPKTGQ